MSQEQQEQVLQNSESQSVDVTVNVGGDSRAERFLGTFDQISRLSLDIDRNYGNKRVLTDFPLVNDGSKWAGTINKLIVGFDYTITGHAYKENSKIYVKNLSTGIEGELIDFPVLDGLSHWNLEIRFKQDEASTDWKAILGSMHSDSNSDNQGWGVFVNNVQQIVWIGDDPRFQFDDFLIEVGQSYKLNIIRNVNTFTFILNNFTTGNRLEKSINYNDYAIATKHTVVSNGMWTGTGITSEEFPGVIDYLSVSENILVDTDNSSYTEIFRGSIQHTVTEGTNSLNLRLSPLLDDRQLTVPRITRINRPFQMVASTSDNITVEVDTVKVDGSSAVDATLSYRFRSVDNDSLPLDNITGGSFSPASGDVTKSGSSYPDISTIYTAPDNDSTMKLQVRVSNELEIGVTSHFNVYVTDDIETQNSIDTNPVIENISAERLDNGDLKWTMNVSNDDGFSGLKVKWEYLFGDNRTFSNKSNNVTQGDSNRGVMQATMSGYQDSDDGMLLVTVCEDGGSKGIPSECAYMNEASTSISMELIPGAYEQPIICDGNNCSFDYEGTWIGCTPHWSNPGGDDDFATHRTTIITGSGRMSWIGEYLENDDGSCNGNVGMTMKWEGSVTDNGSKSKVLDGPDNVTVSNFDVTWDKITLSFNDLSYVHGLKPDNETYLCGESYWTGVEHDVTSCNFKNYKVPDNGTVRKVISHVRDNNTLKIAFGGTTPAEFECDVYGLESDGNYLYPECTSSSSSSGSSGSTGVWDQSTWDNSVFGD